MKKFQKLFDPKFGKKVGGWTPPTNSESRMLSKGKNSEHFWPHIWCYQKKLVHRHPPPSNSETRVFGKGKDSEKCLTSNLAWSKKVGAQTPFPKNSESRALSKGKNSKKFLTSNLEWPKKAGVQTNPPLKLIKIQRPESEVKETILKNFWPQIWCDQKKLVPRPPIPKKISDFWGLSKGKNSEKFLTSNLQWPKKVGAWTNPKPRKIQRPEHLVKEKILKNFRLQIWHHQKR